MTEDENEAVFVRMVNKLYADRMIHFTERSAIKDRLADTTAPEKVRRERAIVSACFRKSKLVMFKKSVYPSGTSG